MIYLTELLSLPVVDCEGRPVGRLQEVALAPGEDPRRVAQFLVRTPDRRRLAVNFDQVAQLSTEKAGCLRTTVPAAELPAYTPRPEHLLVTKDLLDQQIIDINGRKVVRVNDVHFQTHPLQTHHADAQPINGRLECRLAEVDVGLTGAMRRLFQGLLPFSFLRRVETYLRRNVIPWDFVDLIEGDPQRSVKLKITHERLARMHPADLADIVEELAPAEREVIFETLDDVKAAEALTEVEPKVQKSIIEGLDTDKAAGIVEEMAPDEAADLLAELPAETSDEILEGMETKEAAEIEELLEYHKNTAGGMMNSDFVAVADTATVDTAIAALRANRELAASTNTVFLVDSAGRLTGAVPLGGLFLATPSAPLQEVKPFLLLFAHLDSSENDVIELFDKYNLLSLPVVDEQYLLAGIITADDIISVLRARK